MGQQQRQKLAAPATDMAAADTPPAPASALNVTSDGTATAQDLQPQQQLAQAAPPSSGPDTVEESDKTGADDIWLKLKIPAHKKESESHAPDGSDAEQEPSDDANAGLPADYVRYGEPDLQGEDLEDLLNQGYSEDLDLIKHADTQQEGFLVLNKGNTSGTLDFTSHNCTEFVRGDKEEVVLGYLRERVYGDEIQETAGNQLEFFTGGRTEFMSGVMGDYSLGGKVDMSLALEAAANVGAKVDWAFEGVFERSHQKKIEHVKAAEIEAADDITLQVHGHHVPAISALDVTAAACYAAAAGFKFTYDEKKLSPVDYKEKPEKAKGLTTGLGLAMFAASALDVAALKFSKKISDLPKLKLNKEGIVLSVGESKLSMSKEGIKLEGPLIQMISSENIGMSAKKSLKVETEDFLGLKAKGKLRLETDKGFFLGAMEGSYVQSNDQLVVCGNQKTVLGNFIRPAKETVICGYSILNTPSATPEEVAQEIEMYEEEDIFDEGIIEIDDD